MSTSEPFGAPAQGDSAPPAPSAPLAAQSQPGASGARNSGRTWAYGIPALRIGRPAHWRLRGAAGNGVPSGNGEDPAPATSASFGRRIRLVRLVVGAALVAGAWVAALGAYLLGRAALAPVGALGADRLRLGGRALARLAEALGACFVGVVAMLMILVGSFALALVIRPADNVAADVVTDEAAFEQGAAPAQVPETNSPPADAAAAGNGED
ncbi:MAG TPA: hypothetical protein VFU88_06635 [Ktedonobacterales bacterium]|nr:hypothetical protein [Ktedonobacterales bacterium]